MNERQRTARAYYRRVAYRKATRVKALTDTFAASVRSGHPPDPSAWEVVEAEVGAAAYWRARAQGASHAQASAIETDERESFHIRL